MVKTAIKSTEQVELLKPFRIGELVEGAVVGIGRSAIYLDLGARGTGIIYGREFFEEKEALKGVKIGDSLAAKITDLETEDGYIELSLKEAGRELTWDTLRAQKESEELITVEITGANKGGLLAEIKGIQAFLPVSQLSQEHYPRIEDGNSEKILEALQEFVEKKMEVQIFDINPTEEKIKIYE